MASPEVLTKMSLPLLANFLFFTGVNVWLPHAPRAKNWHTIHLINLILGALTCVLAPLCVPVALAWTKPEVKAWFASSADAEP